MLVVNMSICSAVDSKYVSLILIRVILALDCSNEFLKKQMFPCRNGNNSKVGLTAQLLARGIHPEDITHLVITHLHFDHYAGTTLERDGCYVPTFPNARCFIGRADWEYPETQEALKNPNSLGSRTIGALHQVG